MVVIRPTASLAKRMKVKLSSSEGVSSTRLGDWYALDIVLNHKQYILCVCETGRLSVVIPAAPYNNFATRLPDALESLLKKVGVSKANIREEINEMRSIEIAKTSSRSLLGSMNDYRFMLEAHLDTGRLNFANPFELSVYLSETISLAIPEGYPKEAVLNIFSKSPKLVAVETQDFLNTAESAFEKHKNAMTKLK